MWVPETQDVDPRHEDEEGVHDGFVVAPVTMLDDEAVEEGEEEDNAEDVGCV